jgi:hypothetical protein
MALRTEVLIPTGPQHHQKQAAPFDLHAFHYYFSGIWKQRLLFHRTQPENARAALLLPPNIPSEKCLPWFTKCAEEPICANCMAAIRSSVCRYQDSGPFGIPGGISAMWIWGQHQSA